MSASDRHNTLSAGDLRPRLGDEGARIDFLHGRHARVDADTLGTVQIAAKPTNQSMWDDHHLMTPDAARKLAVWLLLCADLADDAVGTSTKGSIPDHVRTVLAARDGDEEARMDTIDNAVGIAEAFKALA